MSARRHRHRRRNGFTLVEVLIALAILAVIGVLAYRAMAALSDGEAKLAAETERWTTLDATFARIESDLRAALPRSARLGEVREPAFAADVDDGGNATFTFTRAGSAYDDPVARAGRRVGYRLRGDTLEIAYWPALDNVAGARPTTYALIPGVVQFHVGYHTRDGRWIAQWPVLGEPELPTAVRIELLLADGAHLERWITLQ